MSNDGALPAVGALPAPSGVELLGSLLGSPARRELRARDVRLAETFKNWVT